MTARGRTSIATSVPHPRHSEDRSCPWCGAPYVNNAKAWQEHALLCPNKKETTMTVKTPKSNSKYVLTDEEVKTMVQQVEKGETYATITRSLGKAGSGHPWYLAVVREAHKHYGGADEAKAVMVKARAARPKAETPTKKKTEAEVRPDPKPAAKKRTTRQKVAA